MSYPESMSLIVRAVTSGYLSPAAGAWGGASWYCGRASVPSFHLVGENRLHHPMPSHKRTV